MAREGRSRKGIARQVWRDYISVDLANREQERLTLGSNTGAATVLILRKESRLRIAKMRAESQEAITIYNFNFSPCLLPLLRSTRFNQDVCTLQRA